MENGAGLKIEFMNCHDAFGKALRGQRTCTFLLYRTTINKPLSLQ
jgi:hypothetical protein